MLTFALYFTLVVLIHFPGYIVYVSSHLFLSFHFSEVLLVVVLQILTVSVQAFQITASLRLTVFHIFSYLVHAQCYFAG
jgi:hypothetical protein